MHFAQNYGVLFINNPSSFSQMGVMSKVCEGLDLYHTGFFKNVFPRAAGSSEHLEVMFTPECLSCAALLPGAPACLWGKHAV